MKTLALVAIGLYQRFISPYKGFSCAYRAYTGCPSCSSLGYRAIRRFGVRHGLQILRSRLAKCGVAHRRYSGTQPAMHGQGGFCDLSCDLPCDFDFGSTACDVLSNCGSAGDCGGWGSADTDRKDEQRVHIPPGKG